MTDFNLVLSQVRQRLEILYQIVDELEAQGGGGGQGGTSDYTQLDNLPKLNSKTITGSHDGSYYGLADAAALADKADKSTTYTKTQVDGLLDDKADKSTTYTKTEVDTALSGKANAATTYTKTETDSAITSGVTAGINALDVSAVGGSTKYLTTISEANGLIDAEAESPDTVPTTDSSKLITSGGVKTALTDLKNAVPDIAYGVEDATILSGSPNLNSLLEPGVYISQNTTITNNTTGGPPIDTPNAKLYRLTVSLLNSARTFQEMLVYRVGTYEGPVERWYRMEYSRGSDPAGSHWNEWHRDISDVDVYAQGTRIQGTSAQHADLDDYWTPGNYYILTATDASNTDNKPYDPDFDVASVRAHIMVYQFSGFIESETRCFQVYVPARTNSSTGSNVMYIRYRYISSGAGAWTAWSAIAGTALGPAPTLNMVSGEMRTAIDPNEDEPQDDER